MSHIVRLAGLLAGAPQQKQSLNVICCTKLYVFHQNKSFWGTSHLVQGQMPLHQTGSSQGISDLGVLILKKHVRRCCKMCDLRYYAYEMETS